MAGNKDFQERLNRIGHDRPDPVHERAPRPRQGANRHRSSSNGALFGVIAIAVLGLVYFYNQYQNRHDPMSLLASAYLENEKSPEIITKKGFYGHERVNNSYQSSCLQFLPTAADGWVRVNTWDTRYPELMPKLEAIWHTAGKSLQDAPSYAKLTEFVTQYSGPNPNQANASFQTSLSSAMYLNVLEDSYLMLNIRSRPWRESTNCRDEFLYQWQQRNAEKPPRYPVLSQFSFKQTSMSGRDVPAALRENGQKQIHAFVNVSPGLEISVNGVAGVTATRDVLNGEDIAQKVNVARNQAGT